MPGQPRLMDIHHVSLLVADTDRSLDFYCRVLGLEVDRARPALPFPGAWLKVGSRQIHLLELPNPDPLEGRPQHGGRDRHTAFLVSDVAGLAERLGAEGIDFTESRSGRAALFCRDPDGNTLELVQAPPS